MGLSSESLRTALRGTGPSSAQSLGPPFLSQGTQDTAPTHTHFQPLRQVWPQEAPAHTCTQHPVGGAFTPRVPAWACVPITRPWKATWDSPTWGSPRNVSSAQLSRTAPDALPSWWREKGPSVYLKVTLSIGNFSF